jgi:hypothetical protein
LRRKKECNAVNNNIERETLIDELIEKTYNEITHDCEKKFNNRSNMYRHKKSVKNNLIII